MLRTPIVACLLAVSLAAAEHSVEELLRSVAATYESTSDYYLEVRSTSKSVQREEKAAFDYILAASLPTHLMVRQRSRTGDRFELRIGTEGSAVWGYLPLAKLYTINGPDKSDESEELRRLHQRFFTRFKLLDRIEAEVESHGSGIVKSDGKPIRCARVRLVSLDGGWTEELWIDEMRCLVLKSVARHKLPVPEVGEIVTSTIWTHCQLNHPPDPALFRFDPPNSAQRTNVLEYR